MHSLPDEFRVATIGSGLDILPEYQTAAPFICYGIRQDYTKNIHRFGSRAVCPQITQMNTDEKIEKTDENGRDE